MFHVVLVAPEIPPNTGNIGRLCLAAGARLHLVKPLGFTLDDKALKRAGLDYWEQVDVQIWDSFDELRTEAGADARFLLLTTKAEHSYWHEQYLDGDYLVFGRETKGLPESLLAAQPDSCLRIPMVEGARSLNLATAVGIVLFEALRQHV